MIYYLDSHDGNDNFIGSSENQAWMSFKKINQMIFGPGDRVLLKRGCIWNETLVINGRGEPGNIMEVGAYGEGMRPHIRMNGDITERCISVNNPCFFKIGDIEVSNGGAGLVVFYEHSYNNENVEIDNIAAHEFFGIYVGCGEYSSKVHWRNYSTRNLDRVGFSYGIGITGVEDQANNQTRVLTGLKITNCEAYKTGAGIALDWYDHHCEDGSPAGPNKFGEVLFENLYLHDNDVEDVSLTSLFIQCCTGAVIRNVLIDRGCRYAFRGTAAVHLQLARNICFQECIIKNTPYNPECNDNGGIDFETDTERVQIEQCHFENIPGAAIMLLGNDDVCLEHPESREFEIKNCTFVNNGYAPKYPKNGQVYVTDFSAGQRPAGIIHDNRWKSQKLTNSGEKVQFFDGDGLIDGINIYNNFEE